MNLINIIKESLKDNNGNFSTTRINGYLLSGLIVLMSLVFTVLEIIRFFQVENYTISFEIIGVFSMLLGHQLVLFNLKKNNEKTSFKDSVNNVLNKKEK